ncbi:nuclear transport factor 2 family protein [Rhodopila sp.]|uniref:nuclear transport factor 2 family protein n=1 Tax=Rhodopila sp. TaxID=2480087 RepID=UPI003D0F376F
MANDLAAIEAVLRTYFDGLYEGSVEKLGMAFHETADLRSVAADGTLSVMSRAAWFEAVRSRPSPKSRDLPRHDWVVTIDRSGPATAFAKVFCAIPPRYFTDYLTLARLPEGWIIVGKTFHTDTH